MTALRRHVVWAFFLSNLVVADRWLPSTTSPRAVSNDTMTREKIQFIYIEKIIPHHLDSLLGMSDAR
jgi:hypothetical protein